MDTPLMQQYKSIKSRFLSHLLLFHLGDFYELFYEDAIFVSNLLGLTLTKKGEVPMCGVPVANLEFYIKKILKDSGRSIAICNQIELASQSKGLVKRDVTKIITPGTYVDPISIDNNFILSITFTDDLFLMVYADIGTGECFFEYIEKENLISEIFKINPSEIIIREPIMEVNIFEDCLVIYNDIKKQRNWQNLNEIENQATNLLVDYIENNGHSFNPEPKQRNLKMYLTLHYNTIKNLEIFYDIENNSQNSLFSILNKTITPMGRRILKNNLLRPLSKQSLITERLDTIEYLIKHNINLSFSSCDLSKLVNMIKNPKDLRRLGEIITEYLDIINKIQSPTFLLQKIFNNIQNITIHKNILKEVSSEPGNIGDGNSFIHSDLNQIYNTKQELITQIFTLPQKYQLNCKVKSNNLIGYFFEFTKQITLSSDFILKQGLSNATRYTNPELLSLESELKNIEQQIKDHEQLVFDKFLQQIQNEKHNIENLAYAIGSLDYFLSCAKVAISNHYIRPDFNNNNEITIINGKHPVLEKMNPLFIPNNFEVNNDYSLLLLTGPNMGGKSTYLRQNAIILLMAHAGMFVPAEKVNTKILDGIFVRIGAQDNIFKNESTFMLEMNECAEIVKNSTFDSFIVLDEIGRGTSIQDGLSISLAILEYIHDVRRCPCIVSTHYTELSLIENHLTRSKNYKMSYLYKEDNIIFLYKVVLGVADKSFGIEVIKKTDMPEQILKRSYEIFKHIHIKTDILHK